jgi:polar amino acid transport system substrate-binding protein
MKTPIMRFLAISTGCALLALSATTNAAETCTPAHKFETITPGTLTVATYELPPYSIPVSDTEARGVDGDILKRIAAKECLKLKFTHFDASAVIQSVISGKTDMAMGDWYRTADRAKVVGLSGPMYLDQMGVVSKDGIDTVSGMQGKKVGLVAGYLWVTDVQKAFRNSTTTYPNSVAMAQDLASGRIDVGTDSYATLVYHQAKGGYPGMKLAVIKPDSRVAASAQAAQTSFPFSKNNPALGDALTANIDQLRASGELGRILKEHGLQPTATEVGTPRLIQ